MGASSSPRIFDFQLSFERDEPHLEVAWTRVERPATPNRQHHPPPADHWLDQRFILV